MCNVLYIFINKQDSIIISIYILENVIFSKQVFGFAFPIQFWSWLYSSCHVGQKKSSGLIEPVGIDLWNT